MDWIRILLSRSAALFRSKKLDTDLDEELRAHIDLAIEENRRRGMNEAQARNAALRAFGVRLLIALAPAISRASVRCR
jgi:hypothetical protein